MNGYLTCDIVQKLAILKLVDWNRRPDACREVVRWLLQVTPHLAFVVQLLEAFSQFLTPGSFVSV